MPPRPFNVLAGMLINVFPTSILRRLRIATLSAIVAFVTVAGQGAVLDGLVQSVAAADASSDIPGIPLPGSVAAGRLGGAIYDVVYRVQMPAGYVMVASLTGTAGTDFDLYLFGSSATTVLSKTGLLKESIGPTSTESLSWPSAMGGTFYIDLNGSTDVEGDFRLAVQMIPDQTPPMAAMVLAGGRGSTNQAAVPVSIQASDDLSGVVEMAFSADGITYSDWQPFQAAATWTFASGDGKRTLWVKVKNGVGLESQPANASVMIDTVAPASTDVSPAPGSLVAGLRPRFAVAFDEPMDPVSWLDLGLIVQGSDGTLVQGSYTYDDGSRTGYFTPSSSLVPGALYVVTIGSVTDVAGNGILPRGSWTIIPTAPTDLEVTTTPRVLQRGGSVVLDVALSGAPDGSSVDVSEKSASAPGFTGVATITLTAGHASLTLTPGENTNYRFRYAGGASVAPAQRDVTVLVRRSILLVGRSSTVTSSATVGRAVKLTAAIGPGAPGVSVSFRLYRFDRSRRTWVYAGSHGKRTDPAGRATITWTPTATGSYYWRAWVESTIAFANNVSPVYRWTVR